jgi:hypothetical protein
LGAGDATLDDALDTVPEDAVELELTDLADPADPADPADATLAGAAGVGKVVLLESVVTGALAVESGWL